MEDDERRPLETTDHKENFRGLLETGESEYGQGREVVCPVPESIPFILL